jgi:peptide chain release factor 1
MSFERNLQRVLDRHQELTHMMSDQSLTSDELQEVSKEYAQLTDVADAVKKLHAMRDEISDLKELAQDPDAGDEMRQMAKTELEELEEKLPDLRHKIKLLLLPKDKADEKNVILEVRAGTGGDEAALFAGDLLEMYKRYADKQGWKFELMEAALTDLGGYREAIANIRGTNVFARLKFESGVHRVQRVPDTETSGRVHTSAATVAVLPEAEEVDVDIRDEDLRIDTYRASGPGGQSVNTTDSAVRITHVPSGIVVSQQDEKSQHKNKAKALRILRSRVFEMERQKQQAERAAARKSQIGTGDRSERIRTYNFPQGRVSDHRINLTLYQLDKVIAGEALDDVIDPLITQDQAERLAALAE